MAEIPLRFLIGYALSPKKIQSFIQPLLKHTAERGIDLIPIDLSKPLIEQGPFHCIIHKIWSQEWIYQLRSFMVRHPKVVLIDYPDSIMHLCNRFSMLAAVTKLSIPKTLLTIPKQVFVESPDSAIVPVDGVDFPLIVKPFVSDGSSDSHQMYLVFNSEGLNSLNLEPPFVLQEFVNHGGVIFKVYVVGRHVQCVKRMSLPDVIDGGLPECEFLMSFSKISNINLHGQVDKNIEKLVEAAEIPEMSFLMEVASQLGKALRLNLFNFDMIRDSRSPERYLVIDIKYFPGFAKMYGFERIMTQFFLDVMAIVRARDSCS